MIKFYSRLVLLTFLAGINFCCKECMAQDGNEITGRFINHTFLEQLPDTIPGLVSSYCFEMNFNSNDSADIFNGFENYKLAYKKDGHNYLLINAAQGKDLFFRFNIDSSLLLIDSSWTGSSQNSLFRKALDNPGNEKWIFNQYINERMITGDYTLFENNNPTEVIVRFERDGNVKGLKNFSAYAICYSGDCVGETNPVSNLISFKSKDGGNVTYAFRIDGEKKILSLYEIASPIDDIKGERAILNQIYDLRK